MTTPPTLKFGGVVPFWRRKPRQHQELQKPTTPPKGSKFLAEWSVWRSGRRQKKRFVRGVVKRLAAPSGQRCTATFARQSYPALQKCSARNIRRHLRVFPKCSARNILPRHSLGFPSGSVPKSNVAPFCSCPVQ